MGVISHPTYRSIIKHSMRALISVYYKEGVEELAKALQELGYEIVSSSSTAKYLMERGLKVKEIEQIPLKNKPWGYPYSKEKYELFAMAQRLVFKKGLMPKASEIYKLVNELRTNENFRNMLKNLI